MGGTLLHLPSGQHVVLDDDATDATFAPTGDLIVGEGRGGVVARYCRSKP